MTNAMKRPGYTKAFRLTTRADHASAERVLASVHAPSLVVMGEKDPDFGDPSAEAAWIGNALDGEVTMVDDAGHYPQSQLPCVDSGEKTAPPALLNQLAAERVRIDRRITDLLAVRDRLNDVIAISQDADSDCSHVQ